MVATPNTRATWNAIQTGYDVWAPLDSGIIFHWNGPVMGNYSMDQVPGIILSTQHFHMFTRGWADIAYNFSIDRFGRLWEGRGERLRNAASGDTFANVNLLACELLLGGFDSGAPGDAFTQEMKDAMVDLGKQYVGEGRTPFFCTHRDVVATYCPGPEIDSWVDNVLPGLVLEGPKPVPQPPVINGDDMLQMFVLTSGAVVAQYFDGVYREVTGAEFAYWSKQVPQHRSGSVREDDIITAEIQRTHR